MSDHDVQAEPHPAPHADVPASTGIPASARYLMIGALLIILMQGAFTFMSSGYGRTWPSTNSTKVQLP